MLEGSLIKIEFETRLPVDATPEQVAEWVKFELGSGSISTRNPLADHDLEYWERLPVLTDLKMTGRTEDYGHTATENGGQKFSRRYVRDEI